MSFGGAAGVGCGAVVPRSRGCRRDGDEEMLSSLYHTDLSPACWRCPRAPNQHQHSAAAPSIALEWEMKVPRAKQSKAKRFSALPGWCRGKPGLKECVLALPQSSQQQVPGAASKRSPAHY